MNFFRNPERYSSRREGHSSRLCGSVLFLAGCTVGPKYNRPPAEVPPAYKEAGNWKTAQPNELSMRGNWWEIFQDTQLNAWNSK